MKRRSFDQFTIRRQLAGLAIGVSLPILAATGYAMQTSREDSGDAAKRTSAQLATVSAASLEGVISDVRAQLTIVAARPLIRRMDPNRCDPFLQVMQEMNDYSANITTISLDGVIVCSALPLPSARPVSVADTEWFKRVRRTGSFAVGEPYVGRVSHRRVAVLARPIEDHGRRVGYVTFPIDLVLLQEHFARLGGTLDSLLVVVTRTGVIVARSQEASRYVGTSLPPETVATLGGPPNVAKGLDGVERIFARAPVAGTTWFVSSGVPTSTAYGPSNRLIKTVLLISSALFLLSLLAAVVLGRAIARPIQALARRARDIAAGNTAAAPLQGPPEVVLAAKQLDEMVAKLARQAWHDGLTGLPNRALLLDRLEVAVARRSRAGEADHPIAVMCLDLDRFKLVNDARGHGVGDLLLVEAAARLLGAVRPGDTVARVGGDEFVILCEDADEAAALAVAGRLRNVFADPIQVGGHRIDVDASIGVALSPPYPGPMLLECADGAMYRAKDEGRGRVRLFDPELATAVERRVAVGAALRVALDSDGLSLHYQPVVNIRTGQLEGVEALLRWNHAVLGQVSPDEIVTAADELGLALALDRWVILRACSDMARRRPPGLRGDTCLSVNISASHIGGPELDDLLATALRDTGWPAEQLILEVTESALMTDAPAVVLGLGRLRAKGITVAIDDFGTGYSSLAYLKRLPVDVLKIDRSFVDQVTEAPESLAIVSSVVELARTLGLRPVAEGIETREQAETLLELGCASGQGYFWSPAIPLHQVGSSYEPASRGLDDDHGRLLL